MRCAGGSCVEGECDCEVRFGSQICGEGDER